MPDNIIKYEYNSNGEVLSAQNKHSKVSYTRDVKDRVLTAQVIGLNEMSNYPENGFSYSYDENDNLTGIGSVYGSQILSYDEINRLTQIQTSSGSQFQFNYDDINRLTKIARPGSLTNFSYNSGGMISDIIHSSNGVTKSFTQYNYDLRNFPIQKRNISGAVDYSFDLGGQVTNVNNPEQALNEVFTYDSIGNRLTDKNGNYVYDQTAQLIKEDYKYFYAHDNNGNLISKTAKDQSNDSFSYTYSSTNQLTSVRIYQDLSSPIKKQINYYYDAYGRRIQKEVIDNIDVSKSNARKFVYNGDNIFVEFNENNQVIAKYTHSPLSPDDILEAEITNDGVQSGIAMNSGKFQYLKDVLGTVTDILDSNGNVIQRYDYSTYGRIRSIKNNAGIDITGAPVVNTSFTFTGREFDSEVGLYYYRARYYDANSGRFLQQDPDAGKLQNPITFVNKYTYVGNNPVMYSDPSGKISWFASMFVGAMIGGAIGIIDWAVNGGDLMEKFTRGAIVGALYGLAFALNPKAALTNLGVHIAEAASQGGNFFENFNSRNDPIKKALGAVAGAWASSQLAEIGNLARFHPEAAAFANLVYGVASVTTIGVLINTADNFLEVACDDGRGSWSRGDICKALK